MDLDRRASLAGLLALAASPALAKPAKVAKASPHWAEVETKAQAMIAGKLTPGLQVCVRKKGAVVDRKSVV